MRSFDCFPPADSFTCCIVQSTNFWVGVFQGNFGAGGMFREGFFVGGVIFLGRGIFW